MLTALSILLTILKVIGIIVLVLLALIILVVCLLLFGPVTLRFRVSHTDAWNGGGNISWLKVALKAVFTYDEAFSFSVRVFGRKIYPKEEKPQGKKSQKEKPEQKKPSQEERPPQDLQMITEEGQAADETKISTEVQNHETIKEKAADSAPEAAKTDAAFEEKGSGKEKKRAGEPKKPFHNPLRGISETLSRIQGILGDEAFHPALDTIFSAVGGFFRSIHVYELKGDAAYSLGSPDLTGIATGVVSLFPAAYGEDLTLTPDFTAEEVMFSGELEGGLRFRLVHLLIAVVKVIKDKNVRKMVHLIRK